MRSPSLYVVIVPGVDMVQMLGKAYDMLHPSDEDMRMNDAGSASSSSSSGPSNKNTRDLTIVKLALEWIEERWPQDLRLSTDIQGDFGQERDPESTPQLVVIFDFLGDAKSGAFHKV